LRAVDVMPLDERHAVAVVEDGAAGRWTVPLSLDAGRVHRARPGDGTAEALVDLLAGPDPRRQGFRATSWRGERLRGERGVTVDQTNESVVVGERAVVKWMVHLPGQGEPGSPAGQRIATLVQAGFDSMPGAWGLLEHVGDGAHPPLLVATVVDLLPGALDGWDWAVGDLGRLVRGDATLEEALAPAVTLGELTARLHVALASDGREAATPDDVAGWRDRALAELAEAQTVVGGVEGDRLTRWAPRLQAAYDEFLGATGTVLTHGHGDLHVGQVLRHPGGYAVTDFDGNPVLAPAQRVRRQPPATDVAGMCASLDHVGRIVLHRGDGAAAEVVAEWIATAQQRFLAAYRAALSSAGARDLLDDRLLRPLRLAQEVREYLYAVRHLPHWVYVPDLALADLLDDPATTPEE
jgi:maltokinase